MSEPSDDELDSARAALAPTLQATADILPLVAKVREPRFPTDKAERWAATVARLNAAWTSRSGELGADLRPAVFALCAEAIELGDTGCLRLTEALAGATDLLEDPARQDDPGILAAISATCEWLTEDNALEHPAFHERTRHLAERLEHSQKPPAARNPTLDALFVDEAMEQIALMHDALDLLPPDAYAIRTAAEEIEALAEPLNLPDLIDRARLVVARLFSHAGQQSDLDNPAIADDLLARIDFLADGIAELDSAPPEVPSPAPIVFPPPRR